MSTDPNRDLRQDTIGVVVLLILADDQQPPRPPERQLSLVRNDAKPEAAVPKHEFGLSAREHEVLQLLAIGRTNREIARELFISPRTASTHVSNILRKLGASCRGEAASTAYTMGIA
jgi:DNA-binding NarL/FixJ family response regulator